MRNNCDTRKRRNKKGKVKRGEGKWMWDVRTRTTGKQVMDNGLKDI